jgi:hypothetical protein
MTLEDRIKDVLNAIGADVKALQQAGGGGGSLPPWQAVTVDLGAPAALRFVFVLVPGMTPADTIEVMRSSAPAPGKGTDEHKAEPVALAAYAAAGGFELVVQALGCTIGGPMTINYRVT